MKLLYFGSFISNKIFQKNLKQSFFKIWTVKKSNWEWFFKPELKTDISLIENQNTKKIW